MSRRKEIKLSSKDSEVLRHIRNSIMHTGKSPSIRELQSMMQYKSPRSITVILKRLMEKGVIERRGEKQLSIISDFGNQKFNASTVNVPLVGMASCGSPLLAEECIQAYFPISTTLAKPPHKYFLLRATGDSMDKVGINDGDLLLVKQEITAKNGDIVVALINSNVTIKKLIKQKNAIILKPCSSNIEHVSIILQSDFSVQGIVIQSFGRTF